MDESAVREYVDRSQSVLEASPQMDEESTKIRLVQPFIDILGWDLYSTEVEPEYTVPIGTGQTKVDYALKVGDTPVVFIEAKAARNTLDEDNVTQLRSYMRQELDVDWGIVTNGEAFEVLSKKGNSGNDAEISIAEFDLADLDDNPGILEILTKEAIESGKAEEVAEQVAQTNQAIRYLSENTGSLAEQIGEVLEDGIGDEVPIDIEEQSTEFLHNLTSVLRERRRFVSEESDEEESDGETDETEEEHGGLQAKRDHVAGTIARADINGDPDAKVAVFPSRKSGLTFLKENNAWGFVRVGQSPEYVAIYVTRDAREVRYLARVKEIVSPENADLTRPPLSYADRDAIDEDKMVIKFEEDTLYELEDTIPFETEYPQALRYTTLGEIRDAETTDDIF